MIRNGLHFAAAARPTTADAAFRCDLTCESVFWSAPQGATKHKPKIILPLTLAERSGANSKSFYSSANAFRMRKPVSPLFSGWNWVPYTLPARTAPVTGMEYSLVASVLSVQFLP